MNVSYIDKDDRHPFEVLKFAAEGANIQVIVAPYGVMVRKTHYKGPLFISMNGTAELEAKQMQDILAQAQKVLADLSDMTAIKRKLLTTKLAKVEKALAETDRAKLSLSDQRNKLEFELGQLTAPQTPAE